MHRSLDGGDQRLRENPDWVAIIMVPQRPNSSNQGNCRAGRSPKSLKNKGFPAGIGYSSDLTGHYLNFLLGRSTLEIQEKTAELEALCVAQYE